MCLVPNGGAFYPPSTRDLMSRIYSPVLLADYRSRRRRETIEEYTSQGGAFLAGGKVFADRDVRICINGTKLRFMVDPQNSSWFDQLRSDIALSLGLAADQYPSIIVSSPVAGVISGKGANDIDRVVLAPRYSLRVSVQDSLVNGVPLPPRPTYSLPVPKQRSVLEASAASSSQSTSSSPSSLENSAALRELIALLKDQVSKRVPDKVVTLRAEGYAAVRAEVLREVSSKEFYGGQSGYDAFWRTAKVKDAGAAINDLASDVAAHVCKIGESLPAGEITSEIFRQSLVGCSIWDDWMRKLKRSRRRRGCRIPCPTDAPGCGYSDARLHVICAPIGSEAVQLVQDQLIASSMEDPYGSKLIACHDGYSSDESPSRASLDCARRKKHYRSHHQHKKHVHPLAPNSTFYSVPARASELPEQPDCKPCKTAKKSAVTDERVELVPISISSLASIGLSRDLTSQQQQQHAGSHVPLSPPVDLSGLELIGCRTCGHGCPSCGTKLDAQRRCPRCLTVAQSVKEIACGCNGGSKKKVSVAANKSKDEHTATTAAAAAPKTKSVTVPATAPSKDERSSIFGTPLVVVPAASIPNSPMATPAPVASLVQARVQATPESPVSLAATASTATTELPEHGKAWVCFGNESAEAVTFRVLLQGKIEVLRSAPIASGQRACAQQTLVAGKYTVIAEIGDAQVAEYKDAPVLQRNLYHFTYDAANKKLKQTIGARFDAQKIAFASKFLSDPAVDKYLKSHPAGVLFAPDNDAFARIGSKIAGTLDDYFVSGTDAVELLRKRQKDESGTEKLMLSSVSGRSTFVRNEENSKIWNYRTVSFSKIQGATKHPAAPGVMVVIIDAPIEDLAA